MYTKISSSSSYYGEFWVTHKGVVTTTFSSRSIIGVSLASATVMDAVVLSLSAARLSVGSTVVLSNLLTPRSNEEIIHDTRCLTSKHKSCAQNLLNITVLLAGRLVRVKRRKSIMVSY